MTFTSRLMLLYNQQEVKGGARYKNQIHKKEKGRRLEKVVCMKELPYFMYLLLAEAGSHKSGEKNQHASWKSEKIQKESEMLFQEMCSMAEIQTDPIWQLCTILMGYSRYRVDTAIWMHSMELLLCKYCN